MQRNERRDRELAIWYLLRHVDSKGSGRVPLQRLFDLIEDEGLMSAGNLRRRLRRGAGIFWDSDTSHIRYRSLAKVCACLGVLPERWPVAIPLAAFRGLGSLRAYFYSTWLNQGCNPISRQTIEIVTGLPKQSQIRYEKAANVRKEKNIAIKPYERGDQIPLGGFLSRDGKTLNVPMPNTFHPLLNELPRGQLKKVRQRIVRGLVKARPNEIIRRYFRTGYEAGKCKQRSPTYFVDRGREWRGKRLWDWCGA